VNHSTTPTTTKGSDINEEWPHPPRCSTPGCSHRQDFFNLRSTGGITGFVALPVLSASFARQSGEVWKQSGERNAETANSLNSSGTSRREINSGRPSQALKYTTRRERPDGSGRTLRLDRELGRPAAGFSYGNPVGVIGRPVESAVKGGLHRQTRRTFYRDKPRIWG
jgi:hypothetical protein